MDEILSLSFLGFLVTDFLTSGLQGPDYLTNLASTATDHAEFTMVTLDFKCVLISLLIRNSKINYDSNFLINSSQRLRTGSTVVSYFTNIGSFYPIVCQPSGKF